MMYPKIKYPLFCRIILYLIAILALLGSVALVGIPAFIPLKLKIGLIIVIFLVFLGIVFKNMLQIMYIDAKLAYFRCYNTARKSWRLAEKTSCEKIEKSVLRMGKSYTPLEVQPVPNQLTYKFSTSLTAYYCGIERVVMSYSIDLLTEDALAEIIKSARENSHALKETKKALFLPKIQKQTPLSRVTVALIFAKAVEDGLSEQLFDILSRESDECTETAFMPCVLDLERKKAIFDSLREPVVGFACPAKNRGFKMINKCIYGGKIRFFDTGDLLSPLDNYDPEMNLRQFIENTKKELVEEKEKTRHRFVTMNHTDIIYENDFLYVKWEDKGVWLFAQKDEEEGVLNIDIPEHYDYPRYAEVPPDVCESIKILLENYFAELSVKTKFVSFDDASQVRNTLPRV